ncbi:phosphoribosyltransferase [Streptomyces lycii]|uniref:Phosphoribosyltransferase n=1 Tax=Streptomyces lycii TaxID=2654337 RepID=A0ABQ7F9V9_9ACTN|nr:phosphoribosyltransferase [Streptomyces lycii]KAF4405537.1 phosphoribosyltransferase [Streptomyces lycii]
MERHTWSGEWVAGRLGVGLTETAPDPAGPGLRDLLGLALRRNPKRAHLLVSNVLGKHVPQRPAVVHGAGVGLGRQVRALLGDGDAARAVVLGYAETATGLGHSVADGLELAPYLHSTRRPVPGVAPVGGFEEEHSHATSHLLLPEDPELLAGDGPLVLVDDEFSTGRTVLNTIRALHERFPRERYVVVALVDMRGAEHRDALTEFAAELGARVDLVALASGTVRLPEDVLKRGQALVAAHEAAPAAAPESACGQAPETTPESVRGQAPDAARGRAPAAAPESACGQAPATAPESACGQAPATAPGREPAAGAVPPGREPGGRPGKELGKEPGGEHGGEPGGGRPGVPSGAVPVPRPAPGTPDAPGDRHPAVRRVDLGWPAGLPDGGRHGFTPAHRATLEAALPGMAARIAAALGTPPGDGPPGEVPPGTAPAHAAAPGGTEQRPRRVLVLGCEELMYAPLRIAEALQDALGDGTEVRSSTTTRSPVLAVDDPGYAVRTRITFPAHDDPADGPGERYAYNVAPGRDPARRFDAVVAVVDSAADTPALHAPDGLAAALAAHTGRVLLAVVPSYVPAHARAHAPANASPYAPSDLTEARSAGPAAPRRATPAPHRQVVPRMLPEPLRGPAFSSYAPEEVGWLLQDLSGVALEAPTEEREEAVQRGGAHYAESLPVEYQPGERYQRLFHSALDASAARIAHAVGTVTGTVLAEGAARGTGRPVLVSLARAGTPVGILMRRWAHHAHGTELPHYAVSIVRGRGIDTTALRWLAAHHDPADVVFVDGWTGKGAITRELSAAIEDFSRETGITGFDPEIAVLADPGGCVRTYGTREDFLIPSACLNSTVSGLISRTVLRADLVGPGDFHGGKFYRELAGADLSGHFLDTVTARFAEVAESAALAAKELLSGDRAPTWEGWAAVERISEEYGIHDVNLVKPGVGETTRVLLRRVPWRILARRGAGADLDHVRLLAEERGVPVEEADELPYSCVGLIHPRYTRGATGADGKAVTSA